MHAVLAAGAAAGSYVFHCAAAEAVIYEEAGGEVSGATALHRPVLLLTSQELVALSGGGTRPAAALPLRGADSGPIPSHPVFKSLAASDQLINCCMSTAVRFGFKMRPENGRASSFYARVHAPVRYSSTNAELLLSGAKLQSDHLLFQLRLESCPHHQACVQPGTVKLHAAVSGNMWLVLMPILRQLVEREHG